jgi:hypothetical protein
VPIDDQKNAAQIVQAAEPGNSELHFSDVAFAKRHND